MSDLYYLLLVVGLYVATHLLAVAVARLVSPAGSRK